MNIYEIFNLKEDKSILEIRVRINTKIKILKLINDCIEEIEYGDVITFEILKSITNRFFKLSMHAYDNQIQSGFITFDDGTRIGLSGEICIEDNKIKYFRSITGLAIRLPHEIKGISNNVIPLISENNFMLNTLIVSPPMCGKTTLLRDIIRIFSNGMLNMFPQNVVVIDERNEISCLSNGIIKNDLGSRTDVLVNINKKDGIDMALRSLNPNIIALDEIGTKDDLLSIEKMLNSGVKFIATIHANNESEVEKRLGEIYDNKIFKRIIFLGRKDKKFIVKEVKKYI